MTGLEHLTLEELQAVEGGPEACIVHDDGYECCEAYKEIQRRKKCEK